jgi:nucleotide-binding universal stress UspA family protein
MFETIIVPLDGSELSETALLVAQELQQKFGSKLILLRAVEPETQRMVAAPGFFESPASAAANVELAQEITEQEEDEATAYLNGVTARLGGDNLEALLVSDDAADAVVNIAKERNASLIVMSSRGRSGLSRLVFGSVAQAVLQNSNVPVLLVKRSEDY